MKSGRSVRDNCHHVTPSDTRMRTRKQQRKDGHRKRTKEDDHDRHERDFYMKDFWNRLPSSLQNYFDSVEPPDLAWLLCLYDDQLKTCCRHKSILPPLSLLALRQCISSLALQRMAVDAEQKSTKDLILAALCREDNKACNKVETAQESSISVDEQDGQKTSQKENILFASPSLAPNYKNGQCVDMHHIYRKHVKPKKQHEINSLGKVISLVNEAVECSAVIDVGAGLGHLARILAFQHGLRVMTIEAAGSHAPKASEFDKDMWKSIHKARVKKKHTAPVVPHSLKGDTDNVQNTAIPLIEKGENEKDCSVHLNNTAVSDLTCNASGISASEPAQQDDPKAKVHEGHCAEFPSHLICTVQPDIAATQFLDLVVNRESTVSESCDGNFVLVSLHACGDLTPTILRVFLNCPTCRGLASVACCYMKMSVSTRWNVVPPPQGETEQTRDPGPTTQVPAFRPANPPGIILDEMTRAGYRKFLSPLSTGIDNFPMSSYLHDLPFQSLSYEAREMACHFADSYHQRLIENPVHLKIHSYRAALQRLVVTVDPSFRSGQARLTSKKGASVSFAEYASENLKKLGISIDSVPEDLMYECTQLTHQWKRVVGFYTLRLSLAPLVETLLLCDRALFLLEQGIPSVLVPIFDPHISPRNFVLLALKP